ncbi:hypothetical protein PAMP_005907 [Pampus punctatissimus]
MSSPCLLPAAPISQPRLREVKISLKAGSRETTAIRSSSGGTREAASRPYATAEKETPVRSRSTPPAHRAQRSESRKTMRSSSSKQQEPEHHLERNGTLLHVPLTVAPVKLSPFSLSSSSSSSCTPRRQRPSHPQPPPTLHSSSSSSSAKSMKRARSLSYSTSNICFNYILDGRFRQLQGTGVLMEELRVFVHLCVCEFLHPHNLTDERDEREAVQKKTFTKWVNSILSRVGCRISDLYLDLRDGRMLIKLLEVLSGERLPKPTKGRMRIHCLENVDKALQFLKEQRVHLENMGSHDIVDGNHRLILGLIWTIILRFQIQDIIVETGQADQKETRSAKDALLLWCQMKTAGYPNVNITNFTTSWKDGMAFNALIHKHRPDLVDYNTLKRSNQTHNLQNAFNVAEQKLGVTKLLDPEGE